MFVGLSKVFDGTGASVVKHVVIFQPININLMSFTLPFVGCPSMPIWSCLPPTIIPTAQGAQAQGVAPNTIGPTGTQYCTSFYGGCVTSHGGAQAQAPGTLPAPSYPMIGCTGYLGCGGQGHVNTQAQGAGFTCGNGGYPTIPPQTIYCGGQAELGSTSQCVTTGCRNVVIPTNNMPICNPYHGGGHGPVVTNHYIPCPPNAGGGAQAQILPSILLCTVGGSCQTVGFVC